MSSEQQSFDEIYISSTEICRDFQVSRAAILYARKRGILPEPITIAGVKAQLWKRAAVMENLNAWKIALKSRRGQLK